MEDAHTAEVGPLDILKSKIKEAVKQNGITSEISEVEIIEPEELKGEHFATETVYAKIRFVDPSVKDKNLFVKKFSSNLLNTEMAKQMKFMEKETAFFNKFLPLARDFCKKFPRCEDLLHFFPNVLYGDDDCLIMENLVLDGGYIMLEKEEQHDFFTAKLVVTHSAKFHAANFALIEDMGRAEFRKKFELNITEALDFASETSKMAPVFHNGVATCMKILTLNPIPGSTVANEKLGALLEKIILQLTELIESNDDTLPLLVLNHGDCWNNNMLFRKDAKTGLVSEHIFVDLQVTRYGSPCLDLGQYLFTTIKPEVRRTQLQDLLKIYYDQFVETSKLLESKCPLTFEEFLVDFKRFSKLGYTISLSCLSASGASKENENDMGTYSEIMMESFSRIENWIQRNPEEANQIAKNLVILVQDFEDIQRW